MADSSQWTSLFLSCVAILLGTLALYLYHKSQYWKRRGVPSIGDIFFGDFKDNILVRESFGDSLLKHNRKYKNLRYTGSFLFGRPVLTLHDPELIKEVFIKEFSNFGGSGMYYDAEKDPLSANLLFLSGPDWRTMRNKLTPAFTSGKIKYMFSTVNDCIEKLQVRLEKDRGEKSHVITDARELMARLATDVILSVTLGISANSVENPNAEFRKLGKLMFESSFSQFVRTMSFLNMHSFVRLFNIKMAPKEVNDFFLNAVQDAVNYREKNNVTRNDFLDLMIQLKNYGTFKVIDGDTDDPSEKGNYLTTNQIAAQAFFFFLAGFETTSSTISYALFELAKNPEIQRKVQTECDSAMKACGGKVNYETIQSLEYIEMVVQESQRLHPAVAVLGRATMSACTLPTTNIKLEKDTLILLSIPGLHLDADFFPNPDTFEPEKFSAENKASIPPIAFMPFAVGPRACIGIRFAMVQVKATILSLLSKYDVELAEGTPSILEYDPRNVIPAPKFPINLKFSPRQQ